MVTSRPPRRFSWLSILTQQFFLCSLTTVSSKAQRRGWQIQRMMYSPDPLMSSMCDGTLLLDLLLDIRYFSRFSLHIFQCCFLSFGEAAGDSMTGASLSMTELRSKPFNRITKSSTPGLSSFYRCDLLNSCVPSLWPWHILADYQFYMPLVSYLWSVPTGSTSCCCSGSTDSRTVILNISAQGLSSWRPWPSSSTLSLALWFFPIHISWVHLVFHSLETKLSTSTKTEWVKHIWWFSL